MTNSMFHRLIFSDPPSQRINELLCYVSLYWGLKHSSEIALMQMFAKIRWGATAWERPLHLLRLEFLHFTKHFNIEVLDWQEILNLHTQSCRLQTWWILYSRAALLKISYKLERPYLSTHLIFLLKIQQLLSLLSRRQYFLQAKATELQDEAKILQLKLLQHLLQVLLVPFQFDPSESQYVLIYCSRQVTKSRGAVLVARGYIVSTWYDWQP